MGGGRIDCSGRCAEAHLAVGGDVKIIIGDYTLNCETDARNVWLSTFWVSQPLGFLQIDRVAWDKLMEMKEGLDARDT